MRCGVCDSENDDNATACRACGSPLTAPSASPSPAVLLAGTRLEGGKFTVGKVLGQGGFGITYLGADTSLGRPIAVKEFFPFGCTRNGATVQPAGAVTVADFQLARQRFLEEARILAHFRHRGIVQVYTTFEENNTAYMVMEFVKGRTLLDLVESRGPLPENEVVGYIAQAADALTTIHATQFLHRDIKPDNLLLTDEGRVVLVDFGTAREFTAGKTRRMTAMLTPGYAPLEQYGQHARFGVFTDVYALAGTCYHLLTGEIPIQATDRATGVDLRSPRSLKPHISQAVSDAVMWAMELRADRRPQSVRDFVQSLTGTHRPACAADEPAVAVGPAKVNPYESRMAQLANELNKPVAAIPVFSQESRVAEIQRTLEQCSAFAVPTWQSCPACGGKPFELVTGRFTGHCPVCRAGKLMKRNLDLTKCPICCDGRLVERRLTRPVMFCPICRTQPLRSEKRKRLGFAIDLWWVCPDCRAEFDVDNLQNVYVKLVRYRRDPFGIGVRYVGQTLPAVFWQQNSPQSTLTRVCGACKAVFYEFANDSMMLVECADDDAGATAKARGYAVPRFLWAKLAHKLPDNAGNVCCPECRSEFDHDSAAETLKLLDVDASRFAWAAQYTGETLPVQSWSFVGDGKRSMRPGWLCRQCKTEFDNEADHSTILPGEPDTAKNASDVATDAGGLGVRLVYSSAGCYSGLAGSALPIEDWYRIGRGLPTAASQEILRRELAQLQAIQQQEESAFRRTEQKQRNDLRRELVKLLRRSALEGFMPFPAGSDGYGSGLQVTEKLNANEKVCWQSTATRYRRRAIHQMSYWTVEEEGRLLVTNERVMFEAPRGKGWKHALGKVRTVCVENMLSESMQRELGYDNNPQILVLGYSGLAIGFAVGEVELCVTIKGYNCRVTLLVEDLAEILTTSIAAAKRG